MKKLFIRLLSSFLAVTFITGCTPISKAIKKADTATTSTGEFHAAIFYYDFSDVFISSVRSALSQKLAQQGIGYSEYDADSVQSTQNAQIESAIKANASVLIVNMVNAGSSDASDSIALKAKKAGIPVIFFNRPIEDDGDEGVVLDYYDNIAFVGTDPAEAGHLQGKMIGEYLAEHYAETDLNGDGIISYALFKGEAKNAEAIYRTKYSVEDADRILLENNKKRLSYFNKSSVDNFQLDLTGKWALSSAQDYMMTNLSRYNAANQNMIELVISNNDSMAEGAIRALQALGYNDPAKKDGITIPVFGVDATAAAKQLIDEGVMTGTVAQDGNSMAECISLMVSNTKEGNLLLTGTEGYNYDREHKLKNKIYIPYSIYDPDKEK